jgi:hypothetical protein
MLLGCGRDPITRENYARIQTGMTVWEVQGILGSGQEPLRRPGTGVVKLPGQVMTAREMVWRRGDKSISAQFVDDRVTSKSESGL